VLGIILLAVGFIASALLLAELALDERARVIKDWGLFCVSIFGVGLAILMGVNQVHKEVRRKTLYVVLSRPIGRWQYVVGKVLGLSITLLIEVGALSLAMMILLWSEGISTDALLFSALLLSLVEILLVAALAVFFASFSSPYLSGLFTLGLFVVGRSIPVLDKLTDRITVPAARGVLKALVQILPDLSSLNISTQAIHGMSIPASELLTIVAYGIGYMIVLMATSAWIFSRRDLT
jgi:Cu-processing system permease protein